MAKIIAHVVAAEGEHCERIAANLTKLAERSRRHFRAHRGCGIHTKGPIKGLRHERHGRAATAAEDERFDGHALRIVVGRVGRRTLRHRRGEAAIGVGGLRFAARRPIFALPVDGMLGRIAVHAFPPNVAVVGECDVGEDRVFLDRGHRVRISLLVGTGCHAEEAGLGVNSIDAAIVAGLDPGNVVADGRDFPTFLLELFGRNEHREIRLTAGTWERGRDVRLFALGALHAGDQHVLGEPTFFAGHHRSDAERQALLAE